MSGYYVFKAVYYMLLLLKLTMYYVVKGYHVVLLQVVCQKQKQQSDGLFLSELHILGPELYCSWRTRLLQATAVRGYHAFKKPCYYMVHGYTLG